ncbi:MAG: cysteine methyltransferase [Anaerolineae bacterium]|nr:cysteine methyltransferase [Anaerolineae bacterium]
MRNNSPSELPLYEQIYNVVRQIPPGKVATYGQVARIVGKCTARMVGYAMSALPLQSDVPWQRVINAQGKISPHGDGIGTLLQRQMLEAEGIVFDSQGKTELDRFGWHGI